jgi:YbbR domain-containing protein
MISKILNWLSENWISLLLSLLLALAVWIVASLEENPFQERDLNVPISIDVVNLEPGLTITSDMPETTRVRMLAQQATWLTLGADDVTVIADLSGLGAGVHNVVLEAEVDEKAKVKSMNPGRVEIVLEELRTREMPVQVITEGNVPIGYRRGDPVASPGLVTVEGPKSLVQLISEVRATVPLDDLSNTINDEIRLVALDKDGEVIEDVTVTPASVRVNVPITLDEEFRPNIQVIPPPVQQPPAGYYLITLTPNPQTITVTGDATVINEMEPYVNTDPIDLTNRTENFIIEVPLNLPPGVTAVGLTSVEVLVEIGVQVGNRPVQGMPIQVVGLEDGLSETHLPNFVNLLLFGPLPILDSLNTLTDVRVTIDLTGLGVGVHQVEPEVSVISDDIQIQSITPALIEVEITRDD